MSIIAIIGTFIGGLVILVFVAGLFMLAGAKLAGVEKATFGTAILAAIACSLVSLALAGIFSIIPLVGTIAGFIISLLVEIFIIKAIFNTSFGKALLTLLCNAIVQIAVAVAIGIIMGLAMVH